MTCEECSGPVAKPLVWTCWSEDARIWCDHYFCSGRCRDTWVRQRHLAAICYRCGERVYPDDVTFRWVPDRHRSEPFHRGCV